MDEGRLAGGGEDPAGHLGRYSRSGSFLQTDSVSLCALRPLANSSTLKHIIKNMKKWFFIVGFAVGTIQLSRAGDVITQDAMHLPLTARKFPILK